MIFCLVRILTFWKQRLRHKIVCASLSSKIRSWKLGGKTFFIRAKKNNTFFKLTQNPINHLRLMFEHRLMVWKNSVKSVTEKAFFYVIVIWRANSFGILYQSQAPPYSFTLICQIFLRRYIFGHVWVFRQFAWVLHHKTVKTCIWDTDLG